jgi:hypothetical protein
MAPEHWPPISSDSWAAEGANRGIGHRFEDGGSKGQAQVFSDRLFQAFGRLKGSGSLNGVRLFTFFA